MRFAVTPYLSNHVVGDVQSGRVGLGMSLAWLPWKYFGFELDGQLHGHFFRDEDVAGLVGEGVDLDTSAALLSASGVFRYCASGTLAQAAPADLLLEGETLFDRTGHPAVVKIRRQHAVTAGTQPLRRLSAFLSAHISPEDP